MISLVTLDVAGTTVDEGGAVYRSLKAAVESALGKTITEDQLRPALGANKREAIAGFLQRFTGSAPSSRVEGIYEDFRARLTQSYSERPPVALPGVEAALAELRSAGIIVALTTGFSRSICDIILGALGWSVGRGANDTVDFMVTSDDVDAGRPSPALIHRSMEWAGVSDPAEVLAAGDTELDLASGMNAGVRYVVAVSTGAQAIEHLATFPHTDLCDVKDLPRFLGVVADGTQVGAA